MIYKTSKVDQIKKGSKIKNVILMEISIKL